MLRASFLAAVFLATAADAFQVGLIPGPASRPARVSRKTHLRMGLDPSLMADSLNHLVPHASSILSDACGSAGACLADAAAGVQAATKAATSSIPPPTGGALQQVAGSAKSVAAAAQPAASAAAKAAAQAQPAASAAAKAAAQAPGSLGDLAKMLPEPLLSAEKSVEAALKELPKIMQGIQKAVPAPVASAGKSVMAAEKSLETALQPLVTQLAVVMAKLTAPVLAAEKSAEVALQPLVKAVTPAAMAISKIIHEISNDSDNDLFNGFPFNANALGMWAVSVFTFSSVAWKDDEVPYGPGQYDPVRADKYYSRRWAAKIGRGLQLLVIVGPWAIGLLRDKYDYGGKNWEKNMPMRAKQILKIVTRLGTTSIKLGQALSIRTDLLPEPYVRELSELQDRVAPFPTTVSRQILREELGLEGKGALEKVFKEISDKPVASASIGQVYKAKLFDGTQVAIKVQRPDVIRDIALDLYIARLLLPIYKNIMKLNTDFVGLVDEWGTGFVNELDYEKEARNGKRFLEAMQSRGLDAVTTAEAFPDLCSGRVLTTRWIDGERLSRSNEEDVGRLCGVALNAYLTMLLDTGLLHCDPHPGNLLRTTDGKLAILDWGMTVEVEKDLQYTLLEYITHLTTEDYAAIPYDLIKLGFVPEGKEEAFTRAGVVEVLTVMLRQLAQGGGPKQIQARLEKELKEEFGDLPREEMRKVLRGRMQEMAERDATSMLQQAGQVVNVNTVAQKIDELQKNSNVFQIPPWMAYILRTFTVLEGVGLNQDPNYSLTKECYPFLSRRLFTDNSPRAQKALKQMLYGATAETPTKMLDVERLRDLSKGFQDYTVTTTSVDRTKGLDNAANQVTEILLSPQGNFVQQVILEEIAAALDAGVREAVEQSTKSPLGQFALATLRQQSEDVKKLPAPLQGLLAPVFLPGELALASLDLFRKDEQDEASIKTARALLSLIEEQQSTQGGAVPLSTAGVPTDPATLQALLTGLQDQRVGISATAARFGVVLLSRVADRLEDSLEDPSVRLPEVSRRIIGQFVEVTDRLIDELQNVADRELQAFVQLRAQALEANPKSDKSGDRVLLTR